MGYPAMIGLPILLSLIVLVSARKPSWNELKGYPFEAYVKDFKKHYRPGSDVWTHRAKIFHDNLRRIRAINRDHAILWRAGVNMFTDMTPAEFKKLNGLRPNEELRKQPTRVHTGPTVDTPRLPIEVDWRTSNSPRVLTAVKHQGSCGSCWAHSAAESMEAQYAFLTGMLPVLSVAQINSCTPAYAPYDSSGCAGGDYVGGWQYLRDSSSNASLPEVLKSLTENWSYGVPISDWFASDQPQGYQTTPCRDISAEWAKNGPAKGWFAELTSVGVSGFGKIDSNSPIGGPAAMKALHEIGPLSVTVAAGNWQWYQSGIFHNTNSSGPDAEWGLDHAVQLVGYGYDKTLDTNFWMVRNSWSTLWGEDGFMRLFRAKDGQPEPCGPSSLGSPCGTSGVLSYPAYPIVYEATPTKFG